MITRVVCGWRVRGLVGYLLGPGRAQEHVRPRVIASWDDRDAMLQSAPGGGLTASSGIEALARALQAPATATGLLTRGRPGGQGYVWHCSVRLAGSDPVLSDARWAEIARELLDGAGVAARDDPFGPRWVAVRHAADHIHIAVVLVRQDTGDRVWPSFDWVRLRRSARLIERRLGLATTAGADGTAARGVSRSEMEKAAQRGGMPARVELAAAVRRAAVMAADVDEFVAALRDQGYAVRLRRSAGRPVGYKVARIGDVTAAGRMIFYGGGSLARDLSLPRLQRVWESSGQVDDSSVAPAVLRARLGRAQQVVAGARAGRPGEDPAGITHACRDVLVALGAIDERFDGVAQTYDRAARAPCGQVVVDGGAATDLRRVARQLLRVGRMVAPDDGGAAMVALVVAMAALLREVAAWQREVGRPHQARAATSAADYAERRAAQAAREVRRPSPSPSPSAVAAAGRRGAPLPRMGRVESAEQAASRR